jgi:hypothetical protein
MFSPALALRLRECPLEALLEGKSGETFPVLGFWENY